MLKHVALRHAAVTALLFAALATLTVACRRAPQAPARPNVLLIVVQDGSLPPSPSDALPSLPGLEQVWQPRPALRPRLLSVSRLGCPPCCPCSRAGARTGPGPGPTTTPRPIRRCCPSHSDGPDTSPRRSARSEHRRSRSAWHGSERCRQRQDPQAARSSACSVSVASGRSWWPWASGRPRRIRTALVVPRSIRRGPGARSGGPGHCRRRPGPAGTPRSHDPAQAAAADPTRSS